MTLNYSNLDVQSNALPGHRIAYFPPQARLRDMGTLASFDYAWGKNLTGATQSWGSSNTTNYYGNATGSSTTSYDITFKKDINTNVYRFILKSSNSSISFDSEVNNTRSITQPLNDSELNLWNTLHTALVGRKITDINFLHVPLSVRSSTGNTATITMSNFRINNNAITIQNNTSVSLTSVNAVQQNLNLFIPISQITGDFNIKFDLTLPSRSLFNNGQETSRVQIQFGESIPLNIVTNSLSYGYRNSPYNQQILGMGGNSPYLWEITSGELFEGLTLNSQTGEITGTPVGSYGTRMITVKLSGSDGFFVTKEFSLTIYEELSIETLSPLENGYVNLNYYLDLEEEGGLQPYRWAIKEGNLPEGLTIAIPTGIISGKPLNSGIFNFTASLTDENNITVERQYSLTILQLNDPICYIGETKVLAKNKETGIESQISVKDICVEKHLVYSTTQKKFVPVRINCVSGIEEKFILVKKDLLGKNKPSEDFFVTPTHPILYKKCEIEAKNIIGAKKITLEKQLIYSLVTDNREALLINNLDVISWKYEDFMKKYKRSSSKNWFYGETMKKI